MIKKFRIEVYDKDSSSHKLKAHDFLGKCDGKIAELVAAQHGKKKFNLLDMRGKKMHGSGKPSGLISSLDTNIGTILKTPSDR